MTFLFLSSLKSDDGIGLIHIAFVLLIITMILSVSMSLTLPSQNSYNVKLTNERMDKIKAAIARYKENVGANPTNIDALVSEKGNPCSLDSNASSPTYRKLHGWCGPYLEQEFANSTSYKQDGWGNILQYNGTTLTSCGQNKTCGDSDDIALAL